MSERIYRCHSIVPTEDDDAAPLSAMDVEGAEKSKLERWNAFLGRERNALDESDRIFCHRCTGMVCPCGEPLTDAGSKHECTALVESDAEAAFDSRTRRLWQMCQHGDLKIELSEACNEIHCLCGCKFCYLSGSNTDDQPAHFAPGGCPWWGNGDSPREQDFDQVVRAPGPYTVEQWNEAIRNAREDELAHPTHSFPEDPLANFDRNLHIILDRNDVRRLLDELRQDLDLDHEEDTVWRYETVLLLSTVEVCLDLLLSRVHAPSAEFADYARAFEGYQNTITEKLDLVPPEYINSQGNVFEIVPSAVAQM